MSKGNVIETFRVEFTTDVVMGETGKTWVIPAGTKGSAVKRVGNGSTVGKSFSVELDGEGWPGNGWVSAEMKNLRLLMGLCE